MRSQSVLENQSDTRLAWGVARASGHAQTATAEHAHAHELETKHVRLTPHYVQELCQSSLQRVLEDGPMYDPTSTLVTNQVRHSCLTALTPASAPEAC